MNEQLSLSIVDETTYTCGARWYYKVYDEMDYDTCGEKAIACSLEDESGRCKDHLDEFIYLKAWGFIHKPKFVLALKDAPKGYTDDQASKERWWTAANSFVMYDPTEFVG